MKLEDMIDFEKIAVKPSGLVVYQKDETIAIYDPKENMVVALYKKVRVNVIRWSNNQKY